MKRRISLFALAICTGVAINAQDAPQLRTPMEVKPSFLFKAGVNLANLEIHDKVITGAKNNSKTSLHAGVFYNIPLAGSLRVQPELLYSIQGSKTNAMTSSDANLNMVKEYDLHYVSLPIMFQYMAPGGLTVELGPQFSYLSSANADLSTGGQSNLKDDDYVKQTDFAAAAGLGYVTRLGLGVNARYVYGLTNVWNNNDRPVATDNWNYRNRVFQIGLTYQFGAAN